MPDRRALITGITGQDGSYLAELLLNKDYEVWGLARQTSEGLNDRNLNVARRIGGDRLHLIPGDLTDPATVSAAIGISNPDEVYNLAAQSFVGESWRMPTYTMEVDATGFIHLLETIREHRPDARVYQASSSEMYGNIRSDESTPLDEHTAMVPRSPYGVAKLAAHRMARVYRESHSMFVVCGICFNHESPRRGSVFVTRKIARAIAEIKAGTRSRLTLGDLRPQRDWGFAPDYVRGMWMIMQADEPSDYVIASGESHSVGEFLRRAFAVADFDVDDAVDRFVTQSSDLFRPAEIFKLVGDSSAIREDLGWQPEVGFQTLVEIMVQTEIAKLEGKEE